MFFENFSFFCGYLNFYSFTVKLLCPDENLYELFLSALWIILELNFLKIQQKLR